MTYLAVGDPERSRLKNLKKVKDYQKRHPDRVAKCQRNGYLKRTFGITLEQYHRLLAAQGNCCAICKVEAKQCKRILSVDHCHKTGGIRGLLCGNCNHVLGFARDSTEILASAIGYLEIYAIFTE